MTSQLLLLLGKSWKTFYRSRGWLITQGVVALLMWGIAGAAMHYIGGGETHGTDSRPAGEVPPEIPSSLNNESLEIRALDESNIDVVFLTKESCDREPPFFTSFHFDVEKDFSHPGQFFDRLEIYAAVRQFGVIAKQFGLALLGYMLPIIFFTLQTALEISQESSSLIKDYLLSMGMSRTLYFLHHFIFHFLKMWISVIVFSVIVGVLGKLGILALHLFLLLTLAIAAWISMALAVGSCFKKPGTTVLVTLMLWLLSIILGFTYGPVSRTSALSILNCLNPYHAIRLAIDAKYEADIRGIPLWFAEVKYAIPQGYYILMLIFDAIFYFFLAVFIDWMRSSFENPISLLVAKRKQMGGNEESKKMVLENQEKSDNQTPAELVIEGLHKIYSTGERAVRGVDMRLHKGQVTALLGHNGAGKSTTFSMISGMTVPTSGRISVNGNENVADRQKMIGYCPQYNAVFPKLTVDEHLDFFARLKGAESGSETGNRVLNILGMADKGDEFPTSLSGGMKRKLCIAISMTADSPIVLLDEPTAGLDPGARRDFEKLLMEWKKEHTILLTTHYTDEAELLADRIFIMAKGKIFCSGSAQFLRKKFDSGYVLSFAVQKESDVERASTELMKIVKDFVPNVSVYKSRGKQFEFKLSTDDTTKFVAMFRKIEEAGPSVGMQSYGLSLNKLEQVFLKVGEMTGTVDRTAEVQTALKELVQENENRLQGPAKLMTQFGNTLLKRLYFDMAHIPSLILRLAFICFYSYCLLSQVTESIVEDTDLIDFLSTSEQFRIGISPSLHGNYSTIQRIASQFGDYLIIDRASEDAGKWYDAESRNRPPILGVISKNERDWTIVIPPKYEVHLAILEAIAAKLNNPSLGKVKFGARKKPESDLEIKERMEGNRLNTNIMYFCFLLILACPLMVIRPIAFLIIEKVSNFGHQERLTGVNRLLFLSSSILYDLFLYLLHFLPFLGGYFASSVVGLLAPVIYLPFIAFLSGELLVVLSYRIFASRAKGEMVILLALIFSAFVTYIGGMIQSDSPTMPTFLLSPMLTARTWKEMAAMFGLWNIMGPIYMGLHFIILFVAILLVEMKLCRKKPATEVVVPSAAPQKSDPTAEGQQKSDNFVLRVNNLNKYYEGRNGIHAVKGISFGVRSHECFGVLGINGAGKSSTFEMLTGNTLPDGGSASVGGVDCSAAPQIGYCPQADALVDDLTGRQSLIVLAALHGYENPRKVADIVITCVGMQEHANKKSKRYSGGQRRKISVAASLLAQNSLIILDEPTAGIDPIARRDIWSVICALRESTNTAIVLTSHSMDEVEALVSNMIIMRSGSIVVEGSPQMIKNQYGDHYSFNLTIENGPKVGEITSHVLSVFPTASLYDSASLRNIKYRIPRHNGDVFSSIFEKAATIAEKLNATDFCFTQATLEDAFMLAATASPQQDAAPVVPSAKSVVTPGTVSSPDPAMVSASQPEPVQKTAKDETVSATQSADH